MNRKCPTCGVELNLFLNLCPLCKHRFEKEPQAEIGSLSIGSFPTKSHIIWGLIAWFLLSFLGVMLYSNNSNNHGLEILLTELIVVPFINIPSILLLIIIGWFHGKRSNLGFASHHTWIYISFFILGFVIWGNQSAIGTLPIPGILSAIWWFGTAPAVYSGSNQESITAGPLGFAISLCLGKFVYQLAYSKGFKMFLKHEHLTSTPKSHISQDIEDDEIFKKITISLDNEK